MDIAYANLYRTEEIGFLLYAVMIGLIIWNFKKSTNVSLLVNCFSAIGLIFYQYFILKQQIVVEASYTSAIASVIVCAGMAIYAICCIAIYTKVEIAKNKYVHSKSN